MSDDRKWLSRRMRAGDVATLADGTIVKVRRKRGSLEVWFCVPKKDRIGFETKLTKREVVRRNKSRLETI